MKEDSPSKITMFFYLLKEGDVKEPLNKYSIIPDKLYIIGRSKKDCDIVLDEKLLSRKHAELIYHNKNEILIRDLNSRNGTYINKNRIEPDKDKYFSINDILSFGHIDNEIVFYDYTENKKEEDTDKEKEKDREINKVNNYNQDKINISEKNSLSKETKKNFDENIIKNDKGYSQHSNNKYFSKKNLSRSRSNSRKKENSKKYSGLEEIIRKFDEQNRENDNEINNYDKYNNRSNRDDYYNRNRKSFGKVKEKDDYIKRNDRLENEYYDRNRRYYDDNRNNNYKRENRGDFNNRDNFEQNGDYVKCYVSGYMMLKIKRAEN